MARIGRERLYVRKRLSRHWRAVPLSRVEGIRVADVCVSARASRRPSR